MSILRYQLSKAKSILPSVIGDLVWPNVWLLDGSEAHSNTSLRILFAGDEREKNYIAHLAFGGDCEQRCLGRKHLAALHGLVQHNQLRASLAVIVGGPLQRRLFAGEGDFYIPLWVEGAVDIPLVARNRSRKEDLRKVHRYKLTYVVTEDLDEFHRFYHEMYLPFVTKRHRDRAIPIAYEDLMEMARRRACDLLLVQRGGEAIAGMVILFPQRLPRLWTALSRTSLPRLWAVGLKGGDLAYRPMGAIAATFYFSSQHLSNEGYQTMDMGLSRAFLRDGVLEYKKRWGMILVGHYRLGFVLKPLTWSAGVRGFLVHNPFAFLEGGQLCGALFTDGSGLTADSSVRDAKSQRCIRGLPRFEVYTCSSSGLELREALSCDAYAGCGR